MIPNIIHFMYFIGENSRPFSYVNYLAVKTAYIVQQPDIIYFYYNVEPKNNPNWEKMKQFVTLVYLNPPTTYKGASLYCPQYQADVIRLQKLLEHGGVYMDTDVLSLKSYENLLQYDCVLGGEGYLNHVDNLFTNDVNKMVSISNAVIMAEPNNKFIQMWLDETPKFMDLKWAYHAVVLPMEMYKKDNTLFHLEPVETFVPFDFRNPYIFDEVDNMKKLNNSYTIHLWDTIWKEQLQKIDTEYLKNSKSLFAKIFKKYI